MYTSSSATFTLTNRTPAFFSVSAAVRMIPDRLALKPGEKHRIQMIAEYTDGTKRDVTRLAIFAVNNDQFAKVDEDGTVAEPVRATSRENSNRPASSRRSA